MFNHKLIQNSNIIFSLEKLGKHSIQLISFYKCRETKITNDLDSNQRKKIFMIFEEEQKSYENEPNEENPSVVGSQIVELSTDLSPSSGVSPADEELDG